MELNPNHAVTSAMREHWQKIVALLMMKFEKQHVEISLEELERFANSDFGAVAISEKDNKIILDLVSLDEAERLAKLAGGLPD